MWLHLRLYACVRVRVHPHIAPRPHAILLREDRTCVDGQARDVRTKSKACTHDDNIIRVCVCELTRVHIVLPLMGTRPVMRAVTFRPAVYARHICVLSYARPCMHASKRTYTHACLPGDMHTCQVRSWPWCTQASIHTHMPAYLVTCTPDMHTCQVRSGPWSLRPGAAPRARL